jgi:thioredoxin reductase/ferredoxin
LIDLENALGLAAAGVLLGAGGYFLARRTRARDRRDRERLVTAREQGLHVPASLHPLFDPNLCIGSLACVAACPEGDVIGVVNGVGTLLIGANCIGHGRCAAECPMHAIQLVFGTSERGVDIPRVTPHFESTVPGIYVAGELGGMGLIRNAVRQGAAAIQHLAESLPKHREGPADDVVIVGAGPGGFSAALAARRAGLRFRVIEQESFGGALAHYPRQKLVLTGPIELPLGGKLQRPQVTKGELIHWWNTAREEHGIEIQEGERVETIVGADGAFRVVTSRASYPTRKVVLAIGRRGTPKRLGVPGEELPLVTYNLIEPEQYEGKKVLVVGGGDSAIEAACQLAETAAAVTLCYRGEVFHRCKRVNRDRIEELERVGSVRILRSVQPVRFEPAGVVLEHTREEGRPIPSHPDLTWSATGAAMLAVDFAIICAGGELPASLLHRLGLQVDRHYGGVVS